MRTCWVFAQRAALLLSYMYIHLNSNAEGICMYTHGVANSHGLSVLGPMLSLTYNQQNLFISISPDKRKFQIRPFLKLVILFTIRVFKMLVYVNAMYCGVSLSNTECTIYALILQVILHYCTKPRVEGSHEHISVCIEISVAQSVLE